MSARLSEVIDYLDKTLVIEQFRDYCPNGLQVEGDAEVSSVVTGVSANLALLNEAHARHANLVVVHHALIWGNGIPRVVGSTAKRLAFLLSNNMSLAGYHLPLDKHSVFGNNAGLADALGLSAERGTFGEVRGHALGLVGELAEPLPLEQFIEQIRISVTGSTAPQFVFPHGPAQVRRVGLCTGAASDLLEDAARAGCDIFITGELAERAAELARELQITLVAAGHYATEVFGPRRLAAEISSAFQGLKVSFCGYPLAPLRVL